MNPSDYTTISFPFLGLELNPGRSFDLGPLTVNFYGLIIGIGSIAVYELFTPLIIRCFIGDAATVGYGVEFLRIRTPATLFMFLSFFIVHIFQALGYGKTALALCTMRWVGFNIPALLILNWCFGMMGIVWAQLVADILTVTVSFIVYRRQIKILQQKQLR